MTKREKPMFRIDSFNFVEMSFEDAVQIMKSRAKGDLLEGLKSMDALWADYIASDDQDDFDFYSNWCYECSAYNIVVKNMRKLFV